MQRTCDILALFSLTFAVGCGALRTRDFDDARPPTGWADVRLAQLRPGTCQAKAFDYCRSLERRGIPTSVAVAQGPGPRAFHAIVFAGDIAVDPTTGDVWHRRNCPHRIIAEIEYRRVAGIYED